MKKTRCSSVFLVLVLFSALLVAACSGNDDPQADLNGGSDMPATTDTSTDADPSSDAEVKEDTTSTGDPTLITDQWSCVGATDRRISGTLSVTVNGKAWGPFSGFFAGGCGNMADSTWTFCEEDKFGHYVSIQFKESKTTLNSDLRILQQNPANWNESEFIGLNLFWTDTSNTTPERITLNVTGGTGTVTAFDCAGDPGSVTGSLTATGEGGEAIAIQFDYTW